MAGQTTEMTSVILHELAETPTIEVPKAEPQLEITPAQLKMLKRLQERAQEGREKAIANLAKYPFVNPDTLEFDEVAGKFFVILTCAVSGIEFRRYTSDLFTLDPSNPTCPEVTKANRKKLNAAQTKVLMALAKERGLI
jgi:hypothetical protein